MDRSPSGSFGLAMLGLFGLIIAFLFHAFGPLSWTLRFGFRFDSGKATLQTVWNIGTVMFDLLAFALWLTWDAGGSWRALAAAWLVPWVGWGVALAMGMAAAAVVN